MKYVRLIWILVHLVVSTTLIGLLVTILGVLDVRKRFIGILPRIWAKWLLWTTGVKYTVDGLENLDPDQKYIFVGNHESALDIPIAVACLPYNIVFLAKKELFRIPVFGWGMWSAGMIRVDRYNREKARLSVDRAIEQIGRTYVSVLVYPEGTRSATAELGRFKKGSYLLAIRTGLPVVPVTIIGSREALPKKTIHFTQRPIHLVVDQPIPTQNLTDADRDTLLEQTREVILETRARFASKKLS